MASSLSALPIVSHVSQASSQYVYAVPPAREGTSTRLAMSFPGQRVAAPITFSWMILSLCSLVNSFHFMLLLLFIFFVSTMANKPPISLHHLFQLFC